MGAAMKSFSEKLLCHENLALWSFGRGTLLGIFFQKPSYLPNIHSIIIGFLNREVRLFTEWAPEAEIDGLIKESC